MGLPREVVGQNPGFRATLMTNLILKPLAEWFASGWRRLSDEQFCETLSSFLRGSNDRGFVVKFPSSLLSSPDSLPAPLSLALVLSMAYEFERRVLLAETAAGTLLRKWAARGTISEEGLAQFQAAARLRRRYNPDGLGDPEEENHSIFYEALVEKLGRTVIPPVLSKEGLLKFLSGVFNRLPAQADNVVRAEVEKAQRRRIDAEDYSDLKVEIAHLDQPVLIAEIRSLPSLTERERQVIDLTLQDLSQEEVASLLVVSQARVSELQSSAIEKIRKAIGPS